MEHVLLNMRQMVLGESGTPTPCRFKQKLSRTTSTALTTERRGGATSFLLRGRKYKILDWTVAIDEWKDVYKLGELIAVEVSLVSDIYPRQDELVAQGWDIDASMPTVEQEKQADKIDRLDDKRSRREREKNREKKHGRLVVVDESGKKIKAKNRNRSKAW